MPRKDFEKLKADDPKLNTLGADTPGVLATPAQSLLGVYHGVYRVTVNNGKLSATKVDDKQKSK